jgi:flagellar hook protein FlgE
MGSGNDMAAKPSPVTAPVEIGTGALTFDANGALTGPATNPSVVVNFDGASANQTISMNFGTSIAAGGTGTDGTTQYSSTSSVSSQGQDGYAAGELSGLSVESNGLIRGVYTNGNKLPIGQLALAKFRSNDGLARSGKNLWGETKDSGPASIGEPRAGGRGAVSSGALEQANVDIAAQFVELITHERAFQANSKTMTTADQMLQELVNLGRS